MQLLLAISALACFLVILNSYTIRVIKDSNASILDSISILIPMRNESVNAAECLESVLNQTGLNNFEILCLDDASTDDTADIIKRFPTVKYLSGSNPPEDWLGKLWACHTLAEKSIGEYLVFIDADVRLSKNAVASSISQMRNWDFVSPYPRQIASGFIQKVFQPLLQWSWLASVPLLLAQKLSIKSMAVANGQFLIIKRNAYFNSGGHSTIKSEVLDDLMLAKQLLEHGYKGGVAEGSQVAKCQMYQSKSELFKGYQKSLWKAFGSIPGTILAIMLLITTGVLPILTAFMGSTTGLIAFGLIAISRVIASLRTSSLPNTALLHPIATILLLSLIAYSWFGKMTKSLTWRDRSVI
jgi:glycosyltransferase involved in cell wall biosynthesis